ncbi:MAG: sulfur carrier protein ThiS [Deltaproteobacteria bacterium]|nr:sulfur carrier protein ThiS [Deltaproteobacteria bacterium]MBW1962823.1 sulfur carrier protein ThiS [Deltaproteobacteria bacterium]
MSETIKITVNGSAEEVPKKSTLAVLIDRFRVKDPGLVVELNGQIVFPQQYASTSVSENDRIEFIHCGFAG